MIEIIRLDEEKSKKLRLKRAQMLADLYANKNSSLLEALESFLGSLEYEYLLLMKNNDDGRHNARGKCDLAATLLLKIKEEVDWVIQELEKAKTKKEKK